VDADEIFAATREQAARLAHVRPARVDYWIRTAVVSPSVYTRLNDRGRVQLFNTRELMALMVASQLRERKISLQHIRAIVHRLRERGYDSPLSELTFATEGKAIYFQDERGEWESGSRRGHTVISASIDLGLLRSRIVESRARSKASRGQVERRRGAMGSKPLFEGTRVPVATVSKYLMAGKSTREVLQAFPTLTAKDVERARRIA